MLFLSLYDVFVIKLSLNSTPYFNLLPKYPRKEQQFISFLERLKEEYAFFFDWVLALNRENEQFIYNRLSPGLIDEFIITEWESRDDVERLMTLQPKGLVWNSSFDFLQTKDDRESKIWERRAQISMDSRPYHINLALQTDGSPEILQKSSSAGIDTIILKSEKKERGEERLRRYSHATRVAVDLGMKVSIGEGLKLEQLKSVLEEVPHVAEVRVGVNFFLMAFSIGIENTFETYLQLLNDY